MGRLGRIGGALASIFTMSPGRRPAPVSPLMMAGQNFWRTVDAVGTDLVPGEGNTPASNEVTSLRHSAAVDLAPRARPLSVVNVSSEDIFDVRITRAAMVDVLDRMTASIREKSESADVTAAFTHDVYLIQAKRLDGLYRRVLNPLRHLDVASRVERYNQQVVAALEQGTTRQHTDPMFETASSALTQFVDRMLVVGLIGPDFLRVRGEPAGRSAADRNGSTYFAAILHYTTMLNSSEIEAVSHLSPMVIVSFTTILDVVPTTDRGEFTRRLRDVVVEPLVDADR